MIRAPHLSPIYGIGRAYVCEIQRDMHGFGGVSERQQAHTKHMYAQCYVVANKKVQSPLNGKTAIVGNVDKILQNGREKRRRAMQTRLRRVSWKLIINLYCHSNIIVNLNKGHIFNAAFQINVKLPMVRFFLLFSRHPLLGTAAHSVRIEYSDRSNLYNVNEDQRSCSDIPFHELFHLLHSLYRSFATVGFSWDFLRCFLCALCFGDYLILWVISMNRSKIVGDK